MSGIFSGVRGPRVAVFQWCIPHYRVALFEQLAKCEDMQFAFFAPATQADNSGAPLFCCGAGVRFPWKRIMSLRVPIPFTGHRLMFQPRVLCSMAKREADVVVLANDILGVDVWISVVLSRALGVRVVLWGHGISKTPKATWRDRVRMVLMKAADAVVFYTDATRDLWVKRGLSAEKLFVAYNSIDSGAAQKARAEVESSTPGRLRSVAGLEGKFVLLFCGRLLPSKKPDVAIRTLARVRSEDQRVHLVIIGDGPMRSECENLMKELKVDQSVWLVGSLYDEQRLAEYFCASGALIMPASGGLAIQHAFVYGVPVLLGDCTSTHGPEGELVRDGETGLYCRDGDAADFAEKTLWLLRNEPIRQEMAVRCERVIEEKYRTERQAAGLVEAIRFATGQRAADGAPERLV